VERPVDKDSSPEILSLVSTLNEVLKLKIKEGSLDKAAAISDKVSKVEGVRSPIKV
jgi:hypothetical protein